MAHNGKTKRFGEGVIVQVPLEGYVRAFFGVGERQVPSASLRPLRTRAERILANVGGSPDRQRRAWLAYEAHALPLMESAAALTSAQIDLLPHQVVLTHRIATASPRRYLIADEVGLGKTTDTVDLEGKRLPALERKGDTLFTWPTTSPPLAVEDRERLLREHLEPMLQRDLQHRGLVPESGGYSSRLIGWVEVVA